MNKRKPETLEHVKLKEILNEFLSSRLEGITLKEYPNMGHEADVFSVTYKGVSVIVEIIWTPTWSHFLKDLDIIQCSSSLIKVLIANPEILNDSKGEKRRHFDKIRIAEIRKGYLISELFDGRKMLDNKDYLENK